MLGNILEPQLFGRRLGLSPLVVFVSLLFWGWVWGPIGMLLSVPLTVIARIVFENSRELRWVAVLLASEPPSVEEEEEALDVHPATAEPPRRRGDDGPSAWAAGDRPAAGASTGPLPASTPSSSAATRSSSRGWMPCGSPGKRSRATAAPIRASTSRVSSTRAQGTCGSGSPAPRYTGVPARSRGSARRPRRADEPPVSAATPP